MNLLVGAVLAVLVATVPMPTAALLTGLSYLAFLQVIAFVLNILPIPGLDGYGAIEPWLSGQARHFGEKARPWAPLVLFMVIIGLPGVARGFFQVGFWVFGLVGGYPELAAYGDSLFRFWE